MSGGESAPGFTLEKPLESGVPPIPPSQIDPGIQHVPKEHGDPDPRAAVKPPNLDPSISTNPDVVPPAREDMNPLGGGAPKGKPNLR
jgi:hypothetical protein